MMLGMVAAFWPFPASAASSSDPMAVYRKNCSSCHGPAMKGGSAPALTGAGFQARWTGRSSAFLKLISTTMPLNHPASLSPAEYRALAGYLLAGNASPAGKSTPGKTVAGKHTAKTTRTAATVRPVHLPSAPKVLGQTAANGPDDAELLNPHIGDWLRYNGDLMGQRYSRLTEITPDNAGKLAPRCIFQPGESGSFQASPVARDGRIYVTTAHRTYAIDGATCRQIWQNEYVATGAELLPTNRGVALYKGLVLRGTLDGHLIALDADSGKPVWDVTVCDSRNGCFLSGAPTVFDGKLFIGEAGADFGGTGHIQAFDAMSGSHLWTFNVIPLPGEPGSETWEKGAVRGGGSMWTTITVEPAKRRLYASVGNPNSDFDARGRPGANLYSDSVVVLDADTGKLLWHVQQIPHDDHDWDTAAAPMIYDQAGREVLAVGSKDGRLYFYDRQDHQLWARKDLSKRLNDTVPLSPSKGVHVCPGILGGVEWNGPALDPGRSMVFVNAVDWCTTLTQEPEFGKGPPYGGMMMMDPRGEARGTLHAFDAKTGAERWVYKADGPMVAGVTPTASGLVFTGTGEGDFLAFNAETGQQLYRFHTGGSIAGGVTPYLANGRQLIAVTSGNSSKTFQEGGSPTLIVFGLP